jgi:hypothetical protein
MAEWQVAIILDGPDWARRSTVADRDGAPRHLHRHMGWPELLRFWLPAWLRDREAFLREVDAAVERATAAAASEAALRPAQIVGPVEPDPETVRTTEPAPTAAPGSSVAPKPRARPRAKAQPAAASPEATTEPTAAPAKRARRKKS